MDPVGMLVGAFVLVAVVLGGVAIVLFSGPGGILRSVRSRYPDRVAFVAAQTPDPQPDLEALTGWLGELPLFVLAFSRDGMTLWRERSAPAVDLPWSRIDAVEVVDFRGDDGRLGSALRLAIRVDGRPGTLSFTTPGATGQFWRTGGGDQRLDALATRIRALR
jgi:hypothetical protein